jgi:anti-sigma regulatory factor (Ser/Thr protein kinase)
MPGLLPHTTDLAIRNDVSELAILRAALDRIGAEFSIPSRPLLQLQVVLDEMVSNVIKYAWPEGGVHEARVRITVRVDDIEVEIVDDGRMFDPLRAPAPEELPAGQRPKPGGVGIHMVRHLVDECNYARIDGHNHLTLTKRFAVAEADR